MRGDQGIFLRAEALLVVVVELAVVLVRLLELRELRLELRLLGLLGFLVRVDLALCEQVIKRFARVLGKDAVDFGVAILTKM